MSVLMVDAELDRLADDLSKRLSVTKEEAVRRALERSVAELERKRSDDTSAVESKAQEEADFVRRGLAHGKELRSRIRRTNGKPLDRSLIDQLYED